MIKLVCVGKCKEKALVQLIQEYTKRISGYSKIEIIETEELMAPQSNSAAQNQSVIDQESEHSLKKIKPTDLFMIILKLNVFSQVNMKLKIFQDLFMIMLDTMH